MKETSAKDVDLATWLHTAQPKDRYHYYTGHLARDIETKKKYIPVVCQELFNLAQSGKGVILAQRRNATGSFDYLAIKIKGKL